MAPGWPARMGLTGQSFWAPSQGWAIGLGTSCKLQPRVRGHSGSVPAHVHHIPLNACGCPGGHYRAGRGGRFQHWAHSGLNPCPTWQPTALGQLRKLPVCRVQDGGTGAQPTMSQGSQEMNRKWAQGSQGGFYFLILSPFAAAF